MGSLLALRLKQLLDRLSHTENTFVGGIATMPALMINPSSGVFKGDLFGFLLALPVTLFLAYWISAVPNRLVVVIGAFVGALIGLLGHPCLGGHTHLRHRTAKHQWNDNLLPLSVYLLDSLSGCSDHRRSDCSTPDQAQLS
jgi:hypothetical protein